MTITSLGPEPAPAKSAPVATFGFGNVLQSEWTKLRSLRSTYWCVGIIALATVGIAILIGIRWADVLATDPPGKGAGFDATNTVLGGVYIAQVALGTLGVLTISSEYSTGMIRATFAAVPHRPMSTPSVYSESILSFSRRSGHPEGPYSERLHAEGRSESWTRWRCWR
jgi:ABC-2 type transport system permease protein